MVGKGVLVIVGSISGVEVAVGIGDGVGETSGVGVGVGVGVSVSVGSGSPVLSATGLLSVEAGSNPNS